VRQGAIEAGGKCEKQPRYKDAKDVHTFISYAIAF